jgi:uncharacterized protein YndB with AHSA1/START domain
MTLDDLFQYETAATRVHASPHAPEKVWRALTQPQHLQAWFPDNVEGDFEPGAPGLSRRPRLRI